MNLTDDQLDYMDEGVGRAERLIGKLRASLARVQTLIPATVDRMAVLTITEETALDAYLKHFQDAYEVGKSLFRSGLLLSGGGWPKLSYVDLVNEAELYGVLPSAAAWLDVRDARNSAAHEYAMRPAQQAALVTEAIKQGEVLVEQLDAALAVIANLRAQAAKSS